MIWAVPRGLDPAHACRYRVYEAYDLTLKSHYVHLIHERAVPAELMGGVMGNLSAGRTSTVQTAALWLL